ncbi:MAG: nucleoside triphosphate pyrophosphohydrolase [Aphanocapsa lilacina HA4352-LM1]|jgi:tetrapyrrole methylase family protein/MazG family protein|nr:nucleoside triphosphate pyrophosphohydrolase [Aphanocapsa lilacina HA4352-LM1]
MLPVLTIVGLGPGSPDQLTPQALAALRGEAPVFLRTAIHPVVPALADLGVRFESFDHLYERCERFEQVYEGIVAELLQALAVHRAAVYAVPGHPLVAEATVQALLAGRGRYRVVLVPGLSYIDAAMTALGLDPSGGLQLLDALKLPTSLNPRQPLLIGQLYSPQVASEVKLQLLEIYPEDHPVQLLHHLGTGEEAVARLPLVELDRQAKIAHLSSLFVPALSNLPPESYALTRAASDLVEVIRRLRDPVGGCPWDLEQTPRTLCKYIIEEAYETVDAIESDDVEAICEELGDLLLQVVLQAQIFSESGEFTLAEVAGGITSKLIRRHPHVFGDTQAPTAEDVRVNWEAIKAQEKPAPATVSAKLEKLARQMPALAAAAEISKKVVKIGFEWPAAPAVWAKLEEELAELRHAMAHESPERQAEELGDVLFTLINVARWQKIEAEAALRETNRRFLARFALVEQLADRDLTSYSIDELEALWQTAKRRLEQPSAAVEPHTP